MGRPRTACHQCKMCRQSQECTNKKKKRGEKKKSSTLAVPEPPPRLSGRKRSLESQVKLAGDEAALLQNSMDAERGQLDEARKHTPEVEAELVRQREHVKQVEIRMDEAAEQTKATERAMGELKRQLVDQAELQAALGDSKTAQDHVGNLLAGAQKEIELLRRRLATECERRQSKECELDAQKEQCQRLPKLEGLVHEGAAARIEMQHRLTLAEEQLANAESHKHSVEEARAAIQTTLEGVREELAETRRQLAAAEGENEDLRAQNLKLLTQRADYEARAEEQTNAINSKDVEIAKLRAQMKKQDQHLTHSFNCLEAEGQTVAQQADEIGKLSDMHKDTRGVLSATKGKLMEMQTALKETQAELAATRMDLEAKAHEMEAAALTAEATLQEVEQDFAAREAELLHNLDAQAADFELRALGHEGVAQALELHLLETEARFELCFARWQQTCRDLEETTAELNNTSEELQAQTEEMGRLQEELEEAHSNSAAQADELRDLTAQLEEAEQTRVRQVADYEEKLEEKASEYDSMVEEKDNAAAAAAAAHAEALDTIEAEKNGEIIALTDIISEKTAEAVREGDRAAAAERRVADLEAIEENLREAVKQTAKALETVEAETARLGSALKDAEAKEDALKKALETSEAEVARLSAANELLQDTLATVKANEEAAKEAAAQSQRVVEEQGARLAVFEAEKAVELRPQVGFLMQAEQNEFKLLAEVQLEKLRVMDQALVGARDEVKASEAAHRDELAAQRVRMDGLEADKAELCRKIDSLAATVDARDKLIASLETELAHTTDARDALQRKVDVREKAGETTIGITADLVDIDGLQRQLRSLEFERTQWEKSLADLAVAHDQVAGENSTLEEQLRVACGKHAALETKHFELTTKLSTETRRVEEHRATHAREMEEVQDKMRSTTIHEGMLATELTQLQDKLRRCEEGFDHALKRVSELEAHLVAAKADAADAKVKHDMYTKTTEETKAYLTSKLDQAEESLQQVSSDLDSSLAAQQALEKRVIDGQKRLADEKEVVEAQEADLREAEERNRDLQEELLRAKQVESEYHILVKRSQDLLDQHTAFKAKTRGVEDENVALQSRNATLNDDVQALKAELESAAAKLVAVETTLGEAEETVMAKDDALKELSARESEARVRITDLETDTARLAAELEAATASLADETAKRQEAEERADEEEARGTAAREELETVEGARRLSEEQLASVLEELAGAKEASAAAATQAAALLTERDELQAGLAATRSDAESLQGKEALRREELHRATLERDAYRKAADASVDALQRLQPEVQRLNDKHDVLAQQLAQKEAEAEAAKAELAEAATEAAKEAVQLKAQLAASVAKEKRLEEKLRTQEALVGEHVKMLEGKLNDAFAISNALEEAEAANRAMKAQLEDRGQALRAVEAEHDAALKKKQAAHLEDLNHHQAKYERQLEDVRGSCERKLQRAQEEAQHRVKETQRRLERQNALALEEASGRVCTAEAEAARAAHASEQHVAERDAAQQRAKALAGELAAAQNALGTVTSDAEQRVADLTTELQDTSQKCISLDLKCEEAITQATSLARQLQETSSELERVRRGLRAGSPTSTHRSYPRDHKGESPERQSDLMKLLEEDL